MRPRIVLWIILSLALLAIWIDVPALDKMPALKLAGKRVDIFGIFPLKLGLDLQGGTQLVLETQMEKISPGNRDNALESAKRVLEKRVNLYGVSEAVVQSSKIGNQRRILIELPGLKDASDAASLVGKTAQFDFREMVGTPSA